MNITDEDNLSPEDYDKKKKKERNAYLEKQIRFSKINMEEFAQIVIANNIGHLDVKKAFDKYVKSLETGKR